MFSQFWAELLALEEYFDKICPNVFVSSASTHKTSIKWQTTDVIYWSRVHISVLWWSPTLKLTWITYSLWKWASYGLNPRDGFLFFFVFYFKSQGYLTHKTQQANDLKFKSYESEMEMHKRTKTAASNNFFFMYKSLAIIWLHILYIYTIGSLILNWAFQFCFDHHPFNNVIILENWENSTSLHLLNIANLNSVVCHTRTNPLAVTSSPMLWETHVSSVRIRLQLRYNNINRWLTA